MDSEFSRKKALIVGALVLVFLAIPVTIYTALQVQESRTRAAPTPIPTPTVIPTPTPILTETKCYECTLYPDVSTITTWTYNQDDTVTIRSTISKTFTDNSYGVNSVGWPSKVRGHWFGDLVGSDNLNVALYDKSGTKVMEFQVDYITESSNVASGYETLCVSSGDGLMITGNASDVVGCRTALSENFNTYGYVLTQDSPATDENYTPNPSYPNWDWDVWYEVTVKTAPFDAGGGIKEPIISAIHSSPSKKGDETCPLTEVACLISNSPTPTPTLSFTPTPTSNPSFTPTLTLTPTFKPTPTLTPSPTLTLTPTPTPTPTPTSNLSITPTIPACFPPGQVTNVRISCPNCTSAP